MAQQTGMPPRSASGAAYLHVVSVAVVLRLVRTRDVHAQVLRLTLGQFGEPHAERVQVEPGDLLVEVLRQGVDRGLVLPGLREELDLSDRLVRERVAHDEAGVPGG